MIFTQPELKFSFLGIGGAGNNVVYKLYKRTHWPNCYLLNTDDYSFAARADVDCIKLGDFTWPTDEKERLTTTISEETISLFLQQSSDKLNNLWDCTPKNIVLIAGLGGKTGNLALPFIIEQLRHRNKITRAFVTLPLGFEGQYRRSKASACLDKVVGLADYTFIQNNTNIGERCKEATVRTLFDLLDDSMVALIERFIDNCK